VFSASSKQHFEETSYLHFKGRTYRKREPLYLRNFIPQHMTSYVRDLNIPFIFTHKISMTVTALFMPVQRAESQISLNKPVLFVNLETQSSQDSKSFMA
jgi:hypothetical protein